MLHLETVESETFAVLKRLQKIPYLESFSLVGGTALSLKYGHRISIDIDLFGNQDFDKDLIIDALKEEFKDDLVLEINRARWAIFCFIKNIKVDIVHYAHPLIKNEEVIEGIKMYSSEDIIAMKFNAILGRGKKKDFWDIYELMHHFTLAQMIAFHVEKFPQQMLLISIPSSITYFEDAEESEDPVSLKGQTWESVKKFIRQKVSDYLK